MKALGKTHGPLSSWSCVEEEKEEKQEEEEGQEKEGEEQEEERGNQTNEYVQKVESLVHPVPRSFQGTKILNLLA